MTNRVLVFIVELSEFCFELSKVNGHFGVVNVNFAIQHNCVLNFGANNPQPIFLDRVVFVKT